MFIEVNGLRLNVVTFGAGPRTFLTHGGWVGNWEVWQQPFELMSRSWRCISYDHRGSGESAAEPESISPQALVDDLMGVMDSLHIDSCVLGGESLGAVVALSVAIQHPERFQGLVLVDGSAAITEAARPLIDGSRSDYPGTVRWFIDACLPEPDSDHLKKWGRDILLRAEPEVAARMLECYLEGDLTPLPLERLTLPTLVLHGTQDAIIPAAVGQRLAERIPNATFVPLAGAGHVPTLTRPVEVVEAIEARFNAG